MNDHIVGMSLFDPFDCSSLISFHREGQLK